MIGKTNVGGGGGSSFTAYIQITTDPSASITAVNLAGDTYSGTADNTGSLTLTVHNPGTYTLTETYSGMTATGTVVVPDIDRYYTTSILTYDGTLYVNGNEFTSITGGYVELGSNTVITRNPDNLYIYAPLTYGGFSTALAVNTDEFTTLNITYSISTDGWSFYASKVDPRGTYNPYRIVGATSGTRVTKTMSVDAHTDFWIAGMLGATGGVSHYMTIHKIWLS